MVTSTYADIMNSKLIAEGVAYDAYMNYHRARLQLDQGLEMVDQLRKYNVEERDDKYLITYRNGFNAGMPCIHASVDKETNDVKYYV